MIEPKEIQINGKTFIISKLPAFEGREIMTGYMATTFLKQQNFKFSDDYKENENLMQKMLKYVSIKSGNTQIALSNSVLIDSHIKSWEDLLELEAEMVDYNCSFFQIGSLLKNLKGSLQKLPLSTIKMSTN